MSDQAQKEESNEKESKKEGETSALQEETGAVDKDEKPETPPRDLEGEPTKKEEDEIHESAIKEEDNVTKPGVDDLKHGVSGESVEEKEVVAKDDQEGVAKDDQEGVAKDDQEGVAKDDQEGVAKDDQEEVAKDDQEGVAKDDQEEVAKDDQEGVAKDDQEEVAKDDQEGVAKDDQEGVAKPQEEEERPGETAAEDNDTKKTKEHPKKETEETEEKEILMYDYEEMKSSPELVNVSVDNMLELHHSFGYECHKRFNLIVMEKDVVGYAAGNLVTIMHLKHRRLTSYRSLGGGGIGAIAAHPSQGFLAVGEKGIKPVIAIYTYPDLQLYRILRGGTEAMYSHMAFSHGDGNLLASVGGNPDYMMTVWDWKKENIVLRSKAFSQDIYRVTFSPDNPQQLTTSGTGHIRFWKMATTFTGLKLQGQLGKFGRIEISDISAYVELPDGKVLSGTEWGNFLLWDGGFIKVELSKKGKKLCHNGMIEAIYLDEGELISAGVDGYIRVWDFETIDSADITDDNTTFEIEPMTEIKVGQNVCFKSLVRSVNPDTPTLWYGQDASGAIWKIDIVVSHTRKAPEKLMTFHGGKVTGINCSPISHQAASISQNGSVRVYNLSNKQLLCHSEFVSGGSSILWAPCSVDPQAVTIIAGFVDGVIRVLRLEEKEGKSHAQRKGHSGKCWLNLLHACKPHNQAITSLAVDPEGKILASGGEDCTVFFLNIEDSYNPIGYVCAPSPITTLRWSQQQRKKDKVEVFQLLVCCDDGSMMEVEAPTKKEFNTSKTFYLDPLKVTMQKFSSIKDRIRAEEEEARRAAERLRKQKEKVARKKARKELLGDDYISEEDEDEVDERVKEGEGDEQGEKENRPKGPSSILGAFYSKEKEGEYWISMDGYDAGYLYCCSMDGAGQEPEPYEPTRVTPVPPIDSLDIPLHSLTFSASGDYLLTGTANGIVRIHPLSTPHTLTDLSSYWSLSMHDNHYGAVTQLATTFDDQFVISGGEDGNVFVYKANLPKAPKKSKAAKIKIPPESKQSAEDIDDPDHYSIEDAKQKDEHDRKMKLAEEKKQHARRQIASLRRTFSKLQNRNAQLPPHIQLESREFAMDPDMEKQMKEQTEKKVELVHKEMSWESEKHKVALNKLKSKYKDIVNCEHFTVWCFKGDNRASSFRTPHPSHRFMEHIEKMRCMNFSHTPWTGTGSGGTRNTPMVTTGKSTTLESGEAMVSEDTITMYPDEEIVSNWSKEDIRKMKKEQIAKEWKELWEKKPDEKAENPEDAAAYKQAKENMGDYKLKTAADYVVPEQLRVTTEKKRRELLLLRQEIFDTKNGFNKKLLSLREKKLQIVDRIKELIERAKSLQSGMSPSHHKPLPPVPIIRPEEVPERKLEYTKESLLKFKDEIASRERDAKIAADGGADGGFFGGFGGGGNDDEEDNKEKVENVVPERDGAGDEEVVNDNNVSDGQEDKGSMQDPSSFEKLAATMTPIQRLRYQEQQIMSVFERDQILLEIERLQNEFDGILMRLCHDKAHIDIMTVAADIKHITQFDEMNLLKEFEKRETSFTSRYRTKKKEKHVMSEKIEECQADISEREKQLAKLQEQEKLLTSTFTESIGENKFKDFILKVFRKKIKRVKRKPETDIDKKDGEEDEEDDESEEETDSDDISSSEEDSGDEEELDDSVCPAGCDQALFNKACEVREKRLDYEELVAEEKRGLDAQRKELESLKKKAKSMETQVRNALSDLQAFQLKKQQRLNELDQVAVLCLHQLLHYNQDGEPPTSIAPCLVFSAPALYQLGNRIEELTLEKQQEKKKYKELKNKYKKLGREKKEILSDLDDLNSQINKSMLLKFGQIVDLEKLEVLTRNPAIDEKRLLLREMERKASREMAAMESKVQQKRRDLASVIQKNTRKLNRMYNLITTEKELEKKLDARQKSISKETAGEGVHLDTDEHQKLLEIVRLQRMDIDAVREEIEILQRKGGHILPPTQPPDIHLQEETV